MLGILSSISQCTDFLPSQYDIEQSPGATLSSRDESAQSSLVRSETRSQTQRKLRLQRPVTRGCESSFETEDSGQLLYLEASLNNATCFANPTFSHLQYIRLHYCPCNFAHITVSLSCFTSVYAVTRLEELRTVFL